VTDLSLQRVQVALAYLVVLGAIGAASACGPLPERGPWLLFVLVAAGLAWCACLARAQRARVGLRWIVLGAVLLRAVAGCGQLGTSDDVYRYVWEGEVLARATSPYAYAPDAPELAQLRADLPELAERVGHPGVSAAYPPLVQLQNYLAVRATHALGAPWTTTIAILRALSATWDLLVLVPLLALLRASGRPPSACVAWAWCPLVVL